MKIDRLSNTGVAIETLVNIGMDHSDPPTVEARLIDIIDTVAVMGDGVKESPADGKLCFVCSNAVAMNGILIGTSDTAPATPTTIELIAVE